MTIISLICYKECVEHVSSWTARAWDHPGPPENANDMMYQVIFYRYIWVIIAFAFPESRVN